MKTLHYKNIGPTIVIIIWMIAGCSATAIAQSDIDLATQGSMAHMHKDYRKAILLLTEAITKNPDLPVIVYRRLAQSYRLFIRMILRLSFMVILKNVHR